MTAPHHDNFRLPLSSLAALTATLILAALTSASAQEAKTDPVGVIKKTIAAGTGTTKTITLLSLPLLDSPTDLDGLATGKLESVTSNTFTDNEAGWTAGELSSAAEPRLVKFTSGAAEGLVLMLSTTTQNSATTATIDSEETAAGINLATLGVAQGDSYKILNCDTLSSAFGTPATTGIVGADSEAAADSVRIFSQGAWRTYFYRSSSNAWVRNALGLPNSDNLRLKPDTGIIFNRIGDSVLSVQVIGDVPTEDRLSLINGNGITFLGSNWPVDTTLLSAGIHQIPGWVADANFNNADTVRIFDGGWKQYWWNGTNWRRLALGNPISDTVPILSGSAVILVKRSAGSSAMLDEVKPYSL